MNFACKPPAALLAVVLCLAAGTAHGFEFQVSGQLNRLLMWADDGENSTFIHADNVNSQTRLRVMASHDFASGLKAGVNWESGYTVNPSSRISMSDENVPATVNRRHADIYFSNDWGRFSLGRGDGAANGGMESDLSGTTVISYSSITDLGGNFVFRDGAAFGPAISSTINNLDFESRYQRLRYDTPRFGPLMLMASEGKKDGHRVSELAAWIASESSRGKIAAVLGWSRERKGGSVGNEDTAGGSISWLSPGGLNLTLALGSSAEDDAAKPRRIFAYGKLGYLYGKHAISLDYAQGRDFMLAGDRSDMVGLGYVHIATKWMELYAGIKRHGLDRAGSDFHAITFVTAGTRLRF